jgi:hypothetical protein
MPFKSEAQRRLFHVKADKGEISKKTVHEWEHETPKKVKEHLPYHVKKTASELVEDILAKMGSELSALETAAPGASSKFWQSITGLSDDVLMAGMRMKDKSDRAKHAAEEAAASFSMLVKMSDMLRGGKADGEPASQYDSHELQMGKQVEQEHTSNSQIAEEIAKDHLEEIPDYYSRLKRMEDGAPKQAMLQEGPLQSSFPNMIQSTALPQQPQQLPPDIFQLLKAQALIDQGKMAAYDMGSGPHLPYQSEQENTGDPQAAQQAMLERLYAEEAQRAQHVQSEYTGKVRRGELAGAGVGALGGGVLGHLLSAGTKGHIPATAFGAFGGGLLGKGAGRSIGQSQGLDYLKQYSGVPWAVQ